MNNIVQTICTECFLPNVSNFWCDINFRSAQKFDHGVADRIIKKLKSDRKLMFIHYGETGTILVVFLHPCKRTSRNHCCDSWKLYRWSSCRKSCFWSSRGRKGNCQTETNSSSWISGARSCMILNERIFFTSARVEIWSGYSVTVHARGCRSLHSSLWDWNSHHLCFVSCCAGGSICP